MSKIDAAAMRDLNTAFAQQNPDYGRILKTTSNFVMDEAQGQIAYMLPVPVMVGGEVTLGMYSFGKDGGERPKLQFIVPNANLIIKPLIDFPYNDRHAIDVLRDVLRGSASAPAYGKHGNPLTVIDGDGIFEM
jgi:hypothetical protein